jgi:hypothetical protein
MRRLIVAATGLLSFASSASAQLQAPSAIVEDVKGKVAGIEYMDFVYPGKVIKLGADGSVVLSYLNSCVRENLKGGVVIVGLEASKVSLTEIETTKVNCDGKRLQLSEHEVSESAATVFRSMKSKPTTAPVEQSTIYGLSPVIETRERGKLVIQRTDQPQPPDEITLTAKSMTKGRFFDFAKNGKTLEPGASYAATVGSRRIDFRVDPLAKPDGPIISRLLRL